MHIFVIFLVLLVYLAAALGFGRINATVLKGKPSPRGLIVLDLVFLPANLFGLLLAACILTPFWWLYPERHLHTLDFEGTDEEMRACTAYKALLSRKSFWRRLAEKLKLVSEAEPYYPMPERDVV